MTDWDEGLERRTMCPGTLENKDLIDRDGTASGQYRAHRRGGFEGRSELSSSLIFMVAQIGQ